MGNCLGDCLTVEDLFQLEMTECIMQIRNTHIKYALQTYSGLTHELENVNFTDGTSTEMNCLFGTIPVQYR